MVPSLFGEFAHDLDDHITITGITQGWDTVRSQVSLCPQWEIIADLDSQAHLFGDVVDRIAATRLLRLGLKVSFSSQWHPVHSRTPLIQLNQFYSAPDPTNPIVQNSIPPYLHPL